MRISDWSSDVCSSDLAVERDRRCLPALAELDAAFPGQLRVLSGDAMEVDARAEAGEGAHVIANLPYNVGTALLIGWLSAERSEEHTSELQSLMRISYAVFCLKKKNKRRTQRHTTSK